MVVKRGMNDDSIVPMARHFRGSGHILRFIEYMDVGAHQRLAHGRRGAGRQRSSPRSTRKLPLEPCDPNYRGEVAERWRYRDGSGEIGVIASVTQAFCRDCTRARLSTEGRLYTCLFAHRRPRLEALLRGGASDEEIARRDRRGVARSATTAIRRSAPRKRPSCARSRCRTSAAEAPDVVSDARRLDQSLPPRNHPRQAAADVHRRSAQRARRNRADRRSPASIRSPSTSTSARSSR